MAAPNDTQHILRISLTIALTVLYLGIAVLAFLRARALSHLKSMNFVFFATAVTHCAVRMTELVLHVIFNDLTDIASVVPTITFQTTLYVYLRVWQVQLETLDSTRRAPSFPLRLVSAWFVAWGACITVDELLLSTIPSSYNSPYCTYLFNLLNYVVIACGFYYLGERIHTTLTSTYGTTSNVFEDHITRVKWFFGICCIARAVFNVLQVKFPSMMNSQIFEPIYVFVVEMVPLAASILSIYWVQHFEETEPAYGVIDSPKFQNQH